ncbi:type III-B CRISPR module-associated protein Cmr5 [Vibrio gazogenes]|uniref:CRISPR type III-B/RAMP module-associated protein Cmr5 n=1 Tax=Vibrio gazogenes TaxID=687 RepID=A0A1Z2SEY2_VIBGA|nr:type III-B CRISPR module-associated protein Cmr5 [Vibrio gazogenes]ASA55740.1 type III-B CRISPR module-associated protein Cmr5 [Vibrio gazogenes]
MSEILLSHQRAMHCYDQLNITDKDTLENYETTVAGMPAFLRNNGLLHFIALLTQKSDHTAYKFCLDALEQWLTKQSWTDYRADEKKTLYQYLLEHETMTTQEHIAIENEVNELLVWLKSLLRAKKTMSAQQAQKTSTAGGKE